MKTHAAVPLHLCAVEKSVGWGKDYHLLLNASKTKEMVVDYRRDSSRRVKTHNAGCAVKRLVGCCNDNHLLLNVSKTKEIVVDFRRDSSQRVKTHTAVP